MNWILLLLVGLIELLVVRRWEVVVEGIDLERLRVVRRRLSVWWERGEREVEEEGKWKFRILHISWELLHFYVVD